MHAKCLTLKTEKGRMDRPREIKACLSPRLLGMIVVYPAPLSDDPAIFDSGCSRLLLDEFQRPSVRMSGYQSAACCDRKLKLVIIPRLDASGSNQL
jgi:hypothetical protein